MNGYQIVIQLEKNCTVEAIQAAQNWLEYNCKDLIVPCIVDLIYRHDNTGSIEKWLICWAEKCNDFFSIFSVLKTTKSLESIDLAKTYLRELSSCSPRTVEIVKLLLQNCRDSETIQICETWLFENWFDLGAGEVLETLVSIRGTTIYETRLTESNCEEDSAGMILVFIKHMLSRKLEEVSLKYIEKHPGTINSALILAELIKKKADIDIVRAVKFQISQSNIKEKGKQVPIILESFSNENRPGEYFLSLAKKHAGFGLKPKSFTAIRLLLEFSEKSDTENWLRKWIVLNANDSITPRLLRILVEQRDCEEILGLASWWLQLSDTKRSELLLSSLLDRKSIESNWIGHSEAFIRNSTRLDASLNIALKLAKHNSTIALTFLSEYCRRKDCDWLYGYPRAALEVLKVKNDSDCLSRLQLWQDFVNRLTAFDQESVKYIKSDVDTFLEGQKI